MTLNIYCLTFCLQLENLYGTALIFKTLRVGFPSAEVHIIDNASIPEARPILKQLAQDCCCHYTQLEDRVEHHEFIQNILLTQLTGTAVFVDGDVVFWQSLESWRFNNVLIAGTLIPQHVCPISNCITQPRLHTSLLWVNDVSALIEKIKTLQRQYFEFNPFSPTMFKLGDTWLRFDTAGTLYAALCQEETYAFGEEELDAFDHLFCGSHLGLLVPRLQPLYAKAFTEVHQKAQVDYKQVRGAWRMQQDFFASLVPCA